MYWHKRVNAMTRQICPGCGAAAGSGQVHAACAIVRGRDAENAEIASFAPVR
jgi:hypothetical protein